MLSLTSILVRQVKSGSGQGFDDPSRLVSGPQLSSLLGCDLRAITISSKYIHQLTLLIAAVYKKFLACRSLFVRHTIYLLTLCLDRNSKDPHSPQCQPDALRRKRLSSLPTHCRAELDATFRGVTKPKPSPKCQLCAYLTFT